MGKNNKNVHVEQLDNTRVRRPLLQKTFRQATPAEQILSYLDIYGYPELPLLSADTRSKKLKEEHDKEGKARLYVKDLKEVREQTQQAVLGLAALGGLAAAQYTPAAPYVNAALATTSAVDLGVQNHENTLGLNPRTVFNVLGLIPLLYGIKNNPSNYRSSRSLNSVSDEKLKNYLDHKSIFATHPTYHNPDIKFIEDNILREISWLPNVKIKLTNNTYTTLLNAVRRMNEPLYQNALSKYLQELRKNGNFVLLDEINEGIKRVDRARKVVLELAVKTFLGYYAIPEEWGKLDNYNFLKDGISGITFPMDGGKAFVRKPVEMLKTKSTTPLHEGNHVYQIKMSPTGKWKDALTVSQLNLYNKVYRVLPTYKTRASADVVEKSATNKELLRLISDMYQQEFNKVPNYWELNEYITKLPKEKLLELFKKPVNAYHQDYLDYYNAIGYNDVDFINNFRNILKFGPMLATPFLINNNLQ